MSKPIITTTTTAAAPSIATVNFNFSTRPSWRDAVSFWNAVYTSVQVTSALEAAFIIASNLLLLAAIVSSPAIRTKLRNQLVLSLVVANLIVGIFSGPFAVDFTVRRDWVHGCYFHVVRVLLTVYVQNFVSLWGAVLLALHYLARLLQYDGPQCLLRLPDRLRRALPGLYVALPWIVAVILCVPLVFGSLHRYVWMLWTDAKCPIVLSRWGMYTLNVLTFFLPSVTGLVVVVAVIVVYRRRLALFGLTALKRMEMGATLVGDGEELEKPYVHVLAVLITIACMGPEHIFFVSRMHVYIPMRPAVVGGVVVMLLSESMPFLLALLFLLMLTDVRARVRELYSMVFRCARGGSPPTSSESAAPPVSFKDLADD